jgi:hypothetical protein
MTSSRFFASLIMLAAALPALAKPNFTGNWKLDTSKSAFGEMPAPSSMTIKVTHEEPKVSTTTSMSSDMGSFDMSANYTTDGKESTNQGFGGATTTSTAKWDGDALSITTKGAFNDSEFTMQDRWTLSEDGKTLTIVRSFKSAMGEGEQKLVLNKQ